MSVATLEYELAHNNTVVTTDTDGNGVGANADSSGGPATVDASAGHSQGAPVCSYEALSADETLTADRLAVSGSGPDIPAHGTDSSCPDREPAGSEANVPHTAFCPK